MKKEENPFKFHLLYHYYLACESLNNKNDTILDYGCGTGEFVSKIKNRAKVYGYDVDEEKIEKNKLSIKEVNFSVTKVGSRLPYKNNFFDKVFIFHVLEHVDSEEAAINEIYRVLKPNGKLIIASPYKGLFSWADMANLRYRFPILHKFFGKIFYGKDQYDKLFVHHKSKLFGDSSPNRAWHKHYTEKEVRELLGNKFSIVLFKKYALLQPFLLTFVNLWRLIFKKDNTIILRTVWFDNYLQVGNLSYFMYIVAVKNEKYPKKF